MTTRTKYLLVTALALILPMRVAADSKREHGEGRMRTYLVLRIADALDLSDEKALAVNRVFRDADAKREETRKKRQEIEDKIRKSLEQSKPDDAALAKLVDQAAELDKQHGQEMEQTFQALKKVLSVEEQAKLVLLRPELRREAHMGGRMGGHGHGGEFEREHKHGREQEHGRERGAWRGPWPDFSPGPAPGDES